MVVQHNMTALNANRYLGVNNSKLSKSLEKLSSGYQINRAGDNAAGLAVSEKMRAQIAGINQGVKNAQDGISMVQTFEGALTETDNILQRMRTLAEQSANGTYQDDVDREAIQLEVDQLVDELNQIADTDFNGVVALNGGVMANGAASNKKTANDLAAAALATPVPATDKKFTNAGFIAGADAAGSVTTYQDGKITYTAATAATANPKDAATAGVSVSNAYGNASAGLTYVDSITLQVGARSKDAVDFTFKYTSDGIGSLNADMNASAFGLGLQTRKADGTPGTAAPAAGDFAMSENTAYTASGTIDVSSQDSANRAIDVIDNAINKVSMIRGTFGAVQNRLEHKIDNLNVTSENLTAAESRIRDTDMASEMMEFTKNNILAQASQSMLAQANQLPQGVLSLLQ